MRFTSATAQVPGAGDQHPQPDEIEQCHCFFPRNPAMKREVLVDMKQVIAKLAKRLPARGNGRRITW